MVLGRTSSFLTLGSGMPVNLSFAFGRSGLSIKGVKVVKYPSSIQSVSQDSETSN